MVRISRPCWDKPHRCPGWAGAGWKFPKEDYCPPSGEKPGYVERRMFKGYFKVVRFGRHYKVLQFNATTFMFGKCNRCGVITLPYFLRKFDPRYYPPMFKLWRMRRSS
jgi:hypothetical protein